MNDTLLAIRDLKVAFHLHEGVVRAVNGVTLEIPKRRTLGLVGESGCGKSVLARTILRILPQRGRIEQGRMLLAPRDGGEPVDLAKLPASGRRMRAIRGGDIAFIFQEPMSSLSPVHTVGEQISEAVRLHHGASRKDAWDRAVEMLRQTGIPAAEKRASAYPHQLSGGLRQRCMIAMALACRPRLLLADEPTTALDVTIQAQILEVITGLQQEMGMSVLMITHDLAVVAETAGEVAVMYLGRVVERASVEALFREPMHPYTKGLLRCVPRLGRGNQARLESIPGSVPPPYASVPGCPFHPRCDRRIAGVCDKGAPPPFAEEEPGHAIACHLYEACRSCEAGV